MSKLKLPEYCCPTCGYLFNTGTYVNDNAEHYVPVEGDFSVCVNCGELLEFDAAIKLIPMTKDLWRNLIRHEDEIFTMLIRIQGRIRLSQVL